MRAAGRRIVRGLPLAAAAGLGFGAATAAPTSSSTSSTPSSTPSSTASSLSAAAAATAAVVANDSGPQPPPPPPLRNPSFAAAPQTADLCDAHRGAPGVIAAPAGLFRDYGGTDRFCGRAVTVKCFESNLLVRRALSGDGRGRVLVVDGGGSRRCALMGDNLGALAAANGWAGVVVFGCVRDAELLRGMPLGVKALGTHPVKSDRLLVGAPGLEVSFAGLRVRPGDFVYADADGFVVAPGALEMPGGDGA